MARLFERLKEVTIYKPVYLAYGVAFPSGEARVYTWDSESGAAEFQMVNQGTVVILGSIKKNSILSKQIIDGITPLIRSVGKKLDDSQLVAAINNRLTNTLSGDSGRKDKVGGLFQVATSNNGCWFCHGFEARAYTQQGERYHVSLCFDNNLNRWYQYNHQNCQRVDLLSIEDKDFRKTPHEKVFRY